MTVSDQDLDARLMTLLTALGERFAGIDITFRRFAPSEWCRAAIGRPYIASFDPDTGVTEGMNARWRVRVVVSKNEREEFRITRYGETFQEAADAVLRARTEA